MTYRPTEEDLSSYYEKLSVDEKKSESKVIELFLFGTNFVNLKFYQHEILLKKKFFKPSV